MKGCSLPSTSIPRTFDKKIFVTATERRASRCLLSIWVDRLTLLLNKEDEEADWFDRNPTKQMKI